MRGEDARLPRALTALPAACVRWRPFRRLPQVACLRKVKVAAAPDLRLQLRFMIAA
jgi:hypothetical protein